FFLAVAPALPWEQRSLETRIFCCRTRLVQPPVAVHEQRACDLGRPEGQEREDEELVPEDVSLVRLAGPAAGRHADVETDRVQGNGLQQVQYVQPKQHRDIQVEAASCSAHVDVESSPVM